MSDPARSRSPKRVLRLAAAALLATVLGGLSWYATRNEGAASGRTVVMAEVLDLVGEKAVGFPVDGWPALRQQTLEAASQYGATRVARVKPARAEHMSAGDCLPPPTSSVAYG